MYSQVVQCTGIDQGAHVCWQHPGKPTSLRCALIERILKSQDGPVLRSKTDLSSGPVRLRKVSCLQKAVALTIILVVTLVQEAFSKNCILGKSVQYRLVPEAHCTLIPGLCNLDQIGLRAGASSSLIQLIPSDLLEVLTFEIIVEPKLSQCLFPRFGDFRAVNFRGVVQNESTDIALDLALEDLSTAPGALTCDLPRFSPVPVWHLNPVPSDMPSSPKPLTPSPSWMYNYN